MYSKSVQENPKKRPIIKKNGKIDWFTEKSVKLTDLGLVRVGY